MQPATITHTSLEQVLHALPPLDCYRLFAHAGLHATLATAGTCRLLGKLLADNALWQAIYQHDFLPTMQTCEARFLDWCARTATKLADAEDDTSLVAGWAMLDWRDTYRRRVCTERNWKQGRYIRRVYAFPQLPGYKIYKERADNQLHGTAVYACAATIRFISRGGRDKPVVDHTYAFDGGCVPNTEQKRHELQKEFDMQPPASLDLVYFNNKDISAYDKPELSKELQARLQRGRGQHPHIDRLHDTVYNALGEMADHYSRNYLQVSRGCWMMFIVLNQRDHGDIIACNRVYGTMRKEPLDIAPYTKLAIVRAASKSIVVYMAGLDEVARNMHWRLLEIFTDRPFKTIRSGAVCLGLEAPCRIDYVFPIVEFGSERVNRIGARINIILSHPSHLCEAIVHDISASTAADTPAPLLLRKSVRSCGLVRITGGFVFVQDNQIICPADDPAQRTKVSATTRFVREPLLGCIFAACESPGQRGRLLLFNGQNGTRLSFSLEDYATNSIGISSHATGIVHITSDWNAIEIYSFGAE